MCVCVSVQVSGALREVGVPGWGGGSDYLLGCPEHKVRVDFQEAGIEGNQDQGWVGGGSLVWFAGVPLGLGLLGVGDGPAG